MTGRIRIGIQLRPAKAQNYKQWRDAVLRAEDKGVDVIFGYDHFHWPAGTLSSAGVVLDEVQPDVNNFEAWTALGSWAEITSRAEIGLLVTGVGYRNPDLLADMARTVDHISDGRLILGVGAGWYERDYTTYGYEFGTTGSRFDLFEESLVRIENRLGQLLPAPVRPIPILIGGGGEKRTIPLVARHAHIWHAFADIDTYRRKNDILIAEAERIGRDHNEIERSTAWGLDPERGLTAAEADAYADVGARLFTVGIDADNDYDLSVLDAPLAWRDSRS
ncbi:Phthiodiolone/phenolphthiodiolone dimycocerosates ketoreductase [Mycobacteroides salmoniphilum]|uniref:Phthiodiolone/phenolphthiodiolone dimycocerosates ketoreductase n=1 Tax=Mycobacteroides salmoniphilum TaxID=404941 RepID=A0A4R8S5J2_9MYCO|nr:LLM class F420-dependent oxidoreductase [Mycobacteroides salmoniphilum]TDZ76971.1 Phthiodiolone/phenolphthiodiolone dimycocerosates ketoreductase [Mycobacteroides salmoniphilum]TDZ85918.1 Phthiodiolone/phenolphthiodiolone dimycocerosates ketoreductase [Mycobacteroides salmoniphilum]TDZ86674.1 Phthiodiolone/phenolphthiodiolone dimycocerosates ketoreductase [Mycobacteroides salmoniphilum]